MNWMDVLRQYRDVPAAPPPQAADDFQAIAREVPREDLSHGIEQAFRSDQTPPMEQMIRHLFEHSDDEQRAGFLNQVAGTLGDGALGLGGGSVADLLRRAVHSRTAITPGDARNVAPQDVESIARAARDNPTLLQRISSFYAQHPQVVQMLGQAALGVAMSAMAQRRRI
jgi:hypothetical protein